MKKSLFLLTAAGLSSAVSVAQKPISKPNIVFVYVDDLGYGDVACYGAKGVETPNVDQLAKGGVQFTDAHCSSATCSPSRFSLLTGKYAFRNDTHILPGDAPLVIPTDKKTLPSMLRESGYTTGVVGKWHLGLGNGNVDWNEDIKPGPLEIGFDYSFLIPATGDRVPCVFVENHNVVGLDPSDPITVSYKKKVGNDPTGREHPELLKMKSSPHQGHDNTIVNGVGRIGYMTGGNSARWTDEDFAPILTKKAISFIDDNRSKPFFLFLSFHDIHVPRVPNPMFRGKSTMGPRGDAIAQMDYCTGEVMKKLRELGLEENTLVVFSSDNGPVLDDGYQDEAVTKIGDHKPGGPFRGGKYSILEAGTRMPFITYWPSHIKPGKSDALICQVDLLASLAKLVGHKLNSDDAPDSFDVMDALLGHSKKARKTMVEASSTKALRMGNWKYIAPHKGPAHFKYVDIESGLSQQVQLYNLKDDPTESNNLASKYPKRVVKMQKELEQIIKAGHSRPGMK